MGLFGIRTAKTRQQKRLDEYITRWNAAATPDQQVYAAVQYLRAVTKGAMSPENKTRVAWSVFESCARMDGVEAELTTDFRHSP